MVSKKQKWKKNSQYYFQEYKQMFKSIKIKVEDYDKLLDIKKKTGVSLINLISNLLKKYDRPRKREK